MNTYDIVCLCLNACLNSISLVWYCRVYSPQGQAGESRGEVNYFHSQKNIGRLNITLCLLTYTGIYSYYIQAASLGNMVGTLTSSFLNQLWRLRLTIHINGCEHIRINEYTYQTVVL